MLRFEDVSVTSIDVAGTLIRDGSRVTWAFGGS